jgi:hypothetical protein
MQFSSHLALQAPRRCTCFWRQPTTMTDTVTCAVHSTTTTNTSTDFNSMSTFPLAPQWQQRRVLQAWMISSEWWPLHLHLHRHQQVNMITYIHLLIIVSCPQYFSITSSHPALCTCMYICMCECVYEYIFKYM